MMSSEATPAAPQTAKAPRRRAPIIAALIFMACLAALFTWLALAKPVDQARRYAKNGDVPLADRYYNEHLLAYPKDTAAQLEYGVFLKKHDADAALIVLQQIPKTAPEFLTAVRHIAHIALIGQQNPLAEAALKILHEAAPDDPAALLALTELYHKQGKDKEALPLAEKCAKLQPERLENHLLLSQVYFGVSRISEMAQPLRKVLERDPNNREAHLNLAFSLAYGEATPADIANARREAEWSREHDAANPQTWRVLAQIERADGNIDLALSHVRKGLELSPDELECRVLEGQLLNFQKKFQEAYDRMYPVYQKHRREQRVVGVLAQATRILEKKEEAAAFQKLLSELGNENYRGDKKAEK